MKKNSAKKATTNAFKCMKQRNTYTHNKHEHTHTLRKRTKKNTPKQGPVTPRSWDLDPGDTRIAEIAGDRKAENEVETNNSSRAGSCKKIKRELQWSVSCVRW
jgi:hypothetical protein